MNLGIGDISKIVGTTGDGTRFTDVKRINLDKRILEAIPSIAFDVKYEHHTLAEIEDEIKNGRPVIAWILPPEASDRDMQHSVVITGIDRDEYIIHYNCPIFGEKQLELGRFMSLWDRTDRTLIKVKVGEREQRILDEWMRERLEVSQ